MNEINISTSGRTKGVSLSLAQIPNAGSINLEHDMSRYYSIITEQYANDAKQAAEEIQNLINSLSIVTTNEIQTITGDKSFTGNLTAQTPSVNDNSQKVATTEFVKNIASNITSTVSNLSDKNLSNLSDNGNSRLHALKGYEDNGELLTDAEGLADVKEYSHSTFDLLKFTVVGSPTITDDGIVSGFSGSNYLTLPYTYSNNTINYKEVIKFTTSSDITTRQPIRGIGENAWKGIGITVNSSKLNCRIGTGTGWNQSNSTVSISANTTYIVEFMQTSTQSVFKLYSESWNLLDTIEVTHTNLLYSQIVLGNNLIWVDEYFKGSIDLKGVNISVDGVPVFLGNRTGIDTIKPNDYTVTGTPTISADGILQSPLTSSNYIETGFTYDISKDFEYSFSAYITAQSGLGDQFLSCLNTGSTIAALRFNGATIYCVFAGSDGILYATYTQSGWYDFIVSKKGTTFTWKYKLSTDNTYTTKSATLTGTYSSTTGTLQIGRTGGSSYMNYAQINLNTFKFFDEAGNLVYQPCLKIPYTESKTGSKIVDSVYRNRVADMYNQFGYAPYYTLSDSNFTLPQGELYGLIRRTSENMMPDYSNAISINDSSYTAPDNGYILGVWSGGSNTASIIKIDDIIVGYGVVAAAHGGSSLIPIAKNSVATFVNVSTKKFIPMKI